MLLLLISLHRLTLFRTVTLPTLSFTNYPRVFSKILREVNSQDTLTKIKVCGMKPVLVKQNY
jgi:hypothetical protein